LTPSKGEAGSTRSTLECQRVWPYHHSG